MIPGQNRFLDQFVKMRQGLSAAATASAPVVKRGATVSTVKGPMPSREMDLAMMCETKPKPKVVKEYFMRRVEELQEE